MSGSERSGGVVEIRRRRERPQRLWDDAAGLVPIAAAIALWGLMVAGVAAPLGDALARLDAGKSAATPASCAPPADAIASAVRPAARPCR